MSISAMQLLDSHLGRTATDAVVNAAIGAGIAGSGAIIYDSTIRPAPMLDQNGKPILDKNGQPITSNNNGVNPYLAAFGGGGSAVSRAVQDYAQNTITARRKNSIPIILE